jgi:hypothetical protein
VFDQVDGGGEQFHGLGVFGHVAPAGENLTVGPLQQLALKDLRGLRRPFSHST